MARNYGKNNQVRFADDHEYYKFLGYLAKSDGSTNIVYERNDQQGAWAPENRIQFLRTPPSIFDANLKYTVGVGNIVCRVNCNEFLQEIFNFHSFMNGRTQNISLIRQSIPPAFQNDFNAGLLL